MIREQLPSLAGVAYLNAGTNGPLPEAALAAMRDEVEAQGRRPRIVSATLEEMLALRERARAGLASALGARPGDVALTVSTTSGIGLVLSGLAWEAGDEVLTTTEEHPGLLAPLGVVARRHGVAVRAVAASDLAASIGPRTRMVAASHVLWTTGAVLPVAAVAEAAHAAGATLLLDAAQAAGAVPVDVGATGADFYAASGQKWLLGPQGTGALWVSPRQQERLEPVLAGYHSFERGRPGELRAGAARFDLGTLDPILLRGLAASLELVEGLPGGRAAWLERAAAAAATARERLAAEPGLRLARPAGEPGTLIALSVEGVEDPQAAAAALVERGVLVRAIPGTPYLRVSVGAWTDERDVDALLEGLRSLPRP